MSLTVALAILAGVVLLGVVVHGAWTTRRAGPRQPQVVDNAEPAHRLEPTLGGVDPAPATIDGEPVVGLPDPVRTAVATRRAARIDALIDAIATVAPETPISGELALQHLPTTRRAGSKPFHIEGLDSETGDWEQPQAGHRYTEFQAAVQLANRHGALNEIEYSEFVQKVQAFADAVGAMPDFPDMLDAVARARELDAFSSAHDAQLTAVLRANSVAWSVGYLQQCAGRHGFVPGVVPGRLVLPSTEEGAPPVLVLAFDHQAALAEDPGEAALREVTLSLDVPQTPEAAEPFSAWQEQARRLADDLDATLVDDQGQPITLHAFAAIGAELLRLYRALESRDLAAGSLAARRLFS
ncbi:cell division protein FtsZ [Ideonella sp. 4Y16]|uniref:Cell division protein ZipA n=1 Tax=Ideonella alba TaxID=2824118 RepID=A0A940YE40_9BURK|nr:cell division protein ZipA C-terminal FtsZ-binding domain-containing protein [Ideonella alba]MBQ0930755.1 cell division protein FtsZ [Ideonella alba]MBQ0944870.1 cell division protein FtsZ [Ideonella alba]